MSGQSGHVTRRDSAVTSTAIRRRMCFCSGGVKGQSRVEQRISAAINRKQLIQKADLSDNLSPPAYLTLSSSSSSEVSSTHLTG